MEIQRSLFLCSSVLGLILSFVAASSSNSIETQKTYYFSPPTHDPPSSHGHSQASGTPSHGGNCSPTPPAHHGGGGGSHHSRPSTPAHIPHPTPSHPSSPVHIRPPTPTITPVTPVTPSHPSSPVHIRPPTPTITPVTPITLSPPSSPAHIPPPTPAITPVTPVIAPPPVPIDPRTGSGPFPCIYWGSHPGVIWRLLGWWATIGGVFGVPTLPGNADPTSLTLHQALTSKRVDGYSSLYREGVASFLNSVAAPKHFPFTTADVRASFVAALRSDKAAASQARLFRRANEGRLKLNR